MRYYQNYIEVETIIVRARNQAIESSYLVGLQRLKNFQFCLL